jgi:hypothetical protein
MFFVLKDEKGRERCHLPPFSPLFLITTPFKAPLSTFLLICADTFVLSLLLLMSLAIFSGFSKHRDED